MVVEWEEDQRDSDLLLQPSSSCPYSKGERPCNTRNLTGADYVIHFDPWWNPAAEDQATDRAHRIGQTRPVTVYRLVAKDTIEEQILQLHTEKRGLVASILEGTDAAAKLSTGELIDLIRSGGRAT